MMYKGAKLDGFSKLDVTDQNTILKAFMRLIRYCQMTIRMSLA